MVSAATMLALQAVGQMCVMLLAGMYVAHFRYLEKRNMRYVSKMVMSVMTPSLLFSNLSAGTSLQVLSTASILPFVAFTLCGCGLLFGYAARKTFLRRALHRGNHAKLFQASCIVGNAQGLPLVLTSALVPSSQWQECVSYISFYLVSAHLVTWFGVYNWLKQDAEDSDEDDDILGEDSKLLSVDFTASPNGAMNGGDAGMKPVTATPGMFYSASPYVERLVDSINPPLVGIILGLIFGIFSPLHRNFAAPGAPFKWVHSAIARVGEGMVPSVMTIMGCSMYYSLLEKRENQLAPSAVVTIAIIRLCMLPVVGIVYVWVFKSMMPGMLCLAILVEACTPSANNVTVILSRLGIDPTPLGPVYIFQYIVAIPLYSVYLAYALQLAESIPPPQAADHVSAALAQNATTFMGIYVSLP
eukprot:TRINITY_DN59254_c0_g1_i1.p1 TRINITY_DN59254_c0_g1~~TRINITY_DN59254_c0_g1_i1.p1  ORF type:complete len:432 (+),score=123.83 TRINITY_DN59254_c0_g1_i1:53-1297(+)